MSALYFVVRLKIISRELTVYLLFITIFPVSLDLFSFSSFLKLVRVSADDFMINYIYSF